MKAWMSYFHITLVVVFLVAPLCQAASAKDSLILAVHPFLSNEELEKKFTPIADYLGRQTGKKIIVRVGSSYEEHILYIGSDKVDIAYMGPASYVRMVNKFGEKPLLAKLEVNGHSYFQGNIIVRKDSGIKSMDDLLGGKRIAFGDPNSTMSYIVPHYMLHKAGVFAEQTTKHQFLHSHNNVALGVLSGDYDAGAVKPAVFRKYEENGLRTIAMTPKISEHLFVVRKNLSTGKIKMLRKAMLGMHKSPKGLAALHAIKKSITGLVKVKSSDYDNLRKIILESDDLH